VSSDSDSEPERKEVKAQKEDEKPVTVRSQPVNQPFIDYF
jgi:hypothetical protein